MGGAGEGNLTIPVLLASLRTEGKLGYLSHLLGSTYEDKLARFPCQSLESNHA